MGFRARALYVLGLMAVVLVPVWFVRSPRARARGGGKDLLSVIVMHHGEGGYLAEFVAHHLVVGVSHVYLYDHLSGEGVVGEGVRRDGRVTCLNTSLLFPERLLGQKILLQRAVLLHWYAKFRDLSEWVLTIDVDEFLYVKEGTVGGFLRGVGAEVGGVMLARVPYSTDGQRERLGDGVLATERYQERMKEEFLGKEAGKIIYRVEMLERMYLNLHEFGGSRGVLVNVEGVHDGGRVEDGMYIVHHVARSLEECLEKRRLSEKWGGGWRHRVGSEWCWRRHREEGKREYGYGYRADWFEKSKLKKWFANRKRRVCEVMKSFGQGCAGE